MLGLKNKWLLFVCHFFCNNLSVMLKNSRVDWVSNMMSGFWDQNMDHYWIINWGTRCTLRNSENVHQTAWAACTKFWFEVYVLQLTKVCFRLYLGASPPSILSRTIIQNKNLISACVLLFLAFTPYITLKCFLSIPFSAYLPKKHINFDIVCFIGIKVQALPLPDKSDTFNFSWCGEKEATVDSGYINTIGTRRKRRYKRSVINLCSEFANRDFEKVSLYPDCRYIRCRYKRSLLYKV